MMDVNMDEGTLPMRQANREQDDVLLFTDTFKDMHDRMRGHIKISRKYRTSEYGYTSTYVDEGSSGHWYQRALDGEEDVPHGELHVSLEDVQELRDIILNHREPMQMPSLKDLCGSFILSQQNAQIMDVSAVKSLPLELQDHLANLGSLRMRNAKVPYTHTVDEMDQVLMKDLIEEVGLTAHSLQQHKLDLIQSALQTWPLAPTMIHSLISKLFFTHTSKSNINNKNNNNNDLNLPPEVEQIFSYDNVADILLKHLQRTVNCKLICQHERESERSERDKEEIERSLHGVSIVSVMFICHICSCPQFYVLCTFYY